MILVVLFANSEGNIRIEKMIPSYSQPLTPHREAWSVSSCKPGNGVASLRDDSLDTYWQSAPRTHPPRRNLSSFCLAESQAKPSRRRWWILFLSGRTARSRTWSTSSSRRRCSCRCAP